MMRTKKIDANTALATLILLFLQIHFWLASTYYEEIPVAAAFREVCLIIALALLFFKMSLNVTFGAKQFLSLIGIILITLAAYFISGGETVLKLLIFAFAIRDVPFKSYVKGYFWIQVLLLVIIVLPASVGIIEMNTRYTTTGILRLSMGFMNPNTAAMAMVCVLPAFNYLYYDKIHAGFLLVEVLYLWIIFSLTYSRGCLTVGAVLLILIFVDKYVYPMEKLMSRKLFRVLIPFFFPIMTFFSYLLAWGVQRVVVLRALDVSMSSRLTCWMIHINSNQVSLLGRQITEAVPLDNAYLFILYRYGLILWIVYCTMFYFLAKAIFDEQNKSMLVIFVYSLVYMLVESQPVIANLNLPLLFMIATFWNIGRKRNSFRTGFLRRRR